MGSRALRKIQMGRETIAGTKVAATVLWRGSGVIDDQREIVFPEEDIGYISGVDRSYIPKFMSQVDFAEIEATFEQLPYIFEAGILAVQTGVADGAGSGYIYTYTFATTAANTFNTYTIEGGDDQQEEEVAYGFIESFNLSGTGGEAVMVSATWIAQETTAGTFTTAPAVPSIEDILFSKGRMYIDADSGTIGSTQVSDTLLSLSLDVTAGIVPKWSADGSLDFQFVQQVRPEVLAEITFEHNASAVTEKAAWRNQTARLIRIEFQGNALNTAGTSYTYKTLRLDMAGKWENFSALDDTDGNDIVTGTFRARYNATAALFAEFVVVNELSALT